MKRVSSQLSSLINIRSYYSNEIHTLVLKDRESVDDTILGA